MAREEVAGMSVGIAFVIVFASMPVTDGKSFSPERYYGWSPEDGGLPCVFLTEDVDGCCGIVGTLTFGQESGLKTTENDN